MPNLRVSEKDLENLLPDVPVEQREQVFASIAWSVIREPGEGFSGVLLQALGPAAALEMELNNLSTKSTKSMLLELGTPIEDINRFGLFETTHPEQRQRWKPRLSLELVRSAIYGIRKIGGSVITKQHEVWPGQLADLTFYEPTALWVRGSHDALIKLQHSIAIVGSRGSTSYGEFATDVMVSALVPKGLSIVSGGAYGIDAIAHRKTLAMQGNTVAVMAGGIDRFYPSGNSELMKRIVQTGAVISEVPPGTSPTKWRFLQRNRLIAALAQSTLVVEANWKSGALNTVSHSERIGREVYAVPGPISSPMSAGTNKLIADGRANLVFDGDDLLDRLGVQDRPITALELSGLGAIEVRVLDAIGFGSADIAEICLSAGLTRDEAKFGLGNLEMDGFLLRRDNTWTRTQTTV